MDDGKGCRNWMLDYCIGGSIGFPPSISDQFCMLNRPASGEHLGKQGFIIMSSRLGFSTVGEQKSYVRQLDENM